MSLVLAATTALQACMAPVAKVDKSPDPATVSLDNALAVKKPLAAVGPETPAPKPIYGPKTTVSFLGDASTLLADAAKGRGVDWSFEVTGPQPHLPIYVQVHLKDVTFAEFLRNVAEQLGQRADVDWSGRSIKLRYRSAS